MKNVFVYIALELIGMAIVYLSKQCTAFRWSISNSQESHLKIKNLISAEGCIYIQKLYGKTHL